MCRADLEDAYHLLQRCEGNPKILDILTLAFAVLGAYGWMIARPRKHLVDNMLILREPPHDVIARMCSGCNKEHLDDPFAYWSKLDTDYPIVAGQNAQQKVSTFYLLIVR
ncbi:hypothetical protein N7490_003048 [Penicillium lividum]|nr:hypothetical protein N7490_003048 [Penicillium lividum]